VADELPAPRTPSPKRLPNPAALYLATLRPSGRLVMAGSLDILARTYLSFPIARSAPLASSATRTSWRSERSSQRPTSRPPRTGTSRR